MEFKIEESSFTYEELESLLRSAFFKWIDNKTLESKENMLQDQEIAKLCENTSWMEEICLLIMDQFVHTKKISMNLKSDKEKLNQPPSIRKDFAEEIKTNDLQLQVYHDITTKAIKAGLNLYELKAENGKFSIEKSCMTAFSFNFLEWKLDTTLANGTIHLRSDSKTKLKWLRSELIMNATPWEVKLCLFDRYKQVSRSIKLS